MIEIHMQHDFTVPVRDVFPFFAEHEKFGEVIGMRIHTIAQSEDGNVGGKGSKRRIHTFPVPAFEEVITEFEPQARIVYQISKGSPLKNHQGTMQFSETETGCQLNYTICFEPKIPLPGLGAVLKVLVKNPIDQGIAKLAQRL